jgi:hypothetical protein
MNGDLDSINLFKGYTQEENSNTHAFLAFLNFLLHADRRDFFKLLRSFNCGDVSTANPEDIEIRCLRYDHGTWDGEIYSKRKRWFLAIESKINKIALSPSQLRRHRQHIETLLAEYDHARLVLLTPFDADWIVKEYLHGKCGRNIAFLSWGDVYNLNP